jgi:serralysin
MNGMSIIDGGVLTNPGASWRLVGTGDFNGDGKSDLLWQNSDGTPAIWEMNGTSVIGGGGPGNPGSAWHLIGTGDFNGDGKDDLVWQNSDGTPAI